MVNPYLSVLKAPDAPRVFSAALVGRLSTGAAGTAMAGVLVEGVGVPWTLASAWACAGIALAVALAGRAAFVRTAPQP
jgi:hypothetical protein